MPYLPKSHQKPVTVLEKTVFNTGSAQETIKSYLASSRDDAGLAGNDSSVVAYRFYDIALTPDEAKKFAEAGENGLGVKSFDPEPERISKASPYTLRARPTTILPKDRIAKMTGEGKEELLADMAEKDAKHALAIAGIDRLDKAIPLTGKERVVHPDTGKQLYPELRKHSRSGQESVHSR